jgi:hypothetical protein
MIRALLLTAALGLAACASDVPDAPATDDPVADAQAPVAPAPDASVPVASAPAAARDTLVVYKSATCGCCRSWGEHMTGEGFAVVEQDVTDLSAIKDRLGVPSAAGSCHTGTVGGYVVEGHVPASVVRQLLRDRPDARGLAVPGMPLGSPGMEQGDLREPYDVLLIANDGTTSVYASIPGNVGL